MEKLSKANVNIRTQARVAIGRSKKPLKTQEQEEELIVEPEDEECPEGQHRDSETGECVIDEPSEAEEQKKVEVVDFEQCLVCLACEEACREEGANCLKVAGCIRIPFKPLPYEDMWVGAREVTPPVKVKTSVD